MESLLGILFFLFYLGAIFCLFRIELKLEKKLKNDERIIERLDLLIHDLRKGRNEQQ